MKCRRTFGRVLSTKTTALSRLKETSAGVSRRKTSRKTKAKTVTLAIRRRKLRKRRRLRRRLTT